MSTYQQLQFFLTGMLSLLLISCGGGSSGTGIVTVEGVIQNSLELPVENALITILETGDTTVSNASGEFMIDVSGVDDEINVEVQAATAESVITVNQVDKDPATTVTLDVDFDEETQQIIITNLEVRAKVVGLCDIYFENFRTIRQSNAAPQGIECTVKVSVKDNGEPRAGIPFKVEYRSCDTGSSWVLESEGITISREEAGTGQAAFRFFDDNDHCVYRVVVPSDVSEAEQVVYEIHTFTRQNQSD